MTTLSAGAGSGGCRHGCTGSPPSFTRFALEMLRIGAGLACRTISGEALLSRDATETGLGLWAASAEAASALLPPSTYSDAWLELANKLHAYRLFADAGAGLAASHGWPGVVRALDRVEPWQRPWMMEGIGYGYADSALRRGMSGARLFVGIGGDEPPPSAMLPLHTGAGLAFAERALQSAPDSGVATATARFWQECLEIAATGYAEPMFEALGLVTITLHPSLIRQMDRQLPNLHPNLGAYFWHGVGRGLYFSPFSFIPLPATYRVLAERSQRLTSSAVGRANALAGLAWAATLVNLRHPGILANGAEELSRWIELDGAFLNGVESALFVWQSIVPGDPLLERLQHFQARNAAVTELWERSFGQAAAASRVSATVHSSGQLGSMFRVRRKDE